MLRDRSHTLEQEFLDPLSFVCLGCVDIALAVCDYAVWCKEQPGLPAAFTKLGKYFQRLSVQYVNIEIAAIGQVNEFLVLIGSKRDIPGRSSQG